MATNHLFWHIATYNDGTVSMAPPHHHIVAIAGIEVQEDYVTAWIKQDADVSTLVCSLDTAFSRSHHVTSFTSTNFGLPVIVSNALRTNTVIGTTLQKVGSDAISHTDLAKELQILTNPDGFMGFELLCHLCNLPKRMDLDVKATWEDPNPKVRKRIGKRLLTDVVLIALGYAHLQYVSNVWDAEQTERFRYSVIDAAAQKAKAVAKMFGGQHDK